MDDLILMSDTARAIGCVCSLKSASNELASVPFMEVDGTNHSCKDACNSAYNSMITLLTSYESAVTRDADIIQKIAANLDGLDTDMKIDMGVYHGYLPEE